MWHNIFALGVSVGEKVVRSVLIYLFLLIAFRVFGKRELGQASMLDLAVLVLVANAVQNGIIGNDVSVTGAVIGGVALFGLNALFSRASYLHPWMNWLLEGDPDVLISAGKAGSPGAASRTHLPPGAAGDRSLPRFGDLGEVYTAIETNGVVSMFRKDEGGRYHPDAGPGGLRIGKHRRQTAGA